MQALAASGGLSITLVDHNQLTGALAQAGLGACVREIVDHHADAGAHAHVVGPLRRISFDPLVRKGVGSTCTLVAEALLAAEDAPAQGAPAATGARAGHLLTPALAQLLLGVVLLDTSCLSSHADKATPRDHAAVAVLHEAAGGASAVGLE